MDNNGTIYRPDGTVLLELPAAVGEQVYVVSGQKRRVYVNRIAEYVICSRLAKNNKVKLVYSDRDGSTHETWWHMNAFGKMLFNDRDEAYKKMEELWNDDVV